MLKKIISLVILFSFVNLISSCSTTGYHTHSTIGESSSTSRIIAHKFPQVIVTTKTQMQYDGKLFSLESANLTMLPFPYWNEEPVDIQLDEIHSIKVMKKEINVGKQIGWGFAIGFLIPGTIGGLTSTYDEDYAGALTASIYTGGFLGFIMGLLAGAASLTEKSHYNFYNFSIMSRLEKISSLKEIMGSF